MFMFYTLLGIVMMSRYIFMETSLLVLQKIEMIDDEESDMISNSEVEQVNSVLDYKVKVISNSEFIKIRY